MTSSQVQSSFPSDPRIYKSLTKDRHSPGSSSSTTRSPSPRFSPREDGYQSDAEIDELLRRVLAKLEELSQTLPAVASMERQLTTLSSNITAMRNTLQAHDGFLKDVWCRVEDVYTYLLVEGIQNTNFKINGTNASILSEVVHRMFHLGRHLYVQGDDNVALENALRRTTFQREFLDTPQALRVVKKEAKRITEGIRASLRERTKSHLHVSDRIAFTRVLFENVLDDDRRPLLREVTSDTCDLVRRAVLFRLCFLRFPEVGTKEKNIYKDFEAELERIRRIPTQEERDLEWEKIFEEEEEKRREMVGDVVEDRPAARRGRATTVGQVFASERRLSGTTQRVERPNQTTQSQDNIVSQHHTHETQDHNPSRPNNSGHTGSRRDEMTSSQASRSIRSPPSRSSGRGRDSSNRPHQSSKTRVRDPDEDQPEPDTPLQKTKKLKRPNTVADENRRPN